MESTPKRRGRPQKITNPKIETVKNKTNAKPSKIVTQKVTKTPKVEDTDNPFKLEKVSPLTAQRIVDLTETLKNKEIQITNLLAEREKLIANQFNTSKFDPVDYNKQYTPAIIGFIIGIILTSLIVLV